jgi:hypothetical protein
MHGKQNRAADLMRTQNFFAGEGADPEAICNLFDFKNYAVKIML